MSDFLKLVGEHLRRIREAKNLTQEQLAERTETSGSRISDIERGKTNISLKTLERIMIALQISPAELFDFQKTSGLQNIQDKKMLLDVYKSLLMDRRMDEIHYVVRATKDFLEVLDSREREQGRINRRS